jgi:hypothetical protein
MDGGKGSIRIRNPYFDADTAAMAMVDRLFIFQDLAISIYSQTVFERVTPVTRDARTLLRMFFRVPGAKLNFTLPNGRQHGRFLHCSRRVRASSSD